MNVTRGSMQPGISNSIVARKGSLPVLSSNDSFVSKNGKRARSHLSSLVNSSF